VDSDLLSAKSVALLRFIFDPSHRRRPHACIFADIYKRFVRRGRFSSLWENGAPWREPKQCFETIHRTSSYADYLF
jgi:hypothetical protein